MEAQLTNRGQRAVEILRAGGKFRKALETQYRGGEKFAMRLRDAQGQIVKGFGFQTFYELLDAKVLSYQRAHDAVGSAWPQEWVLCVEGMVPTTSKF